ncbi:hypothetical protein Rrhod_0578 [Rhodococcus rhodnii LMG 5362]|uniref:YqaJ viral recombinase domain-containing protein n=1 Tax=Rhodococcus rhodnii LMG 5362 TaxID=1273125 RepID=R7WRS3_9NOCA|nr:hypothetical protein Rrhod_0578 [Rhodococcus rhodnii LMG 5362]
MSLAPGSPEWARTITASKIPAILGVSRFQSQFSLWHEMAGNYRREISDEKRDLFDYGHAVELAAAHYWKSKNPGWRLSPGERQFTRDDLPFANAATIDRQATRGRARRVVEIKTARSLEEWGDDGTGEVPADYAAQVIWQQYITGWHDRADLVLWPQYGMPRIYHVEYDAPIADVIVQRAAAWHQSLIDGTPPLLDDTIATYETVRALHPDIDADTETEIDLTLAVDYLAATAELRDLEAHVRGLKSRVLDRMGNTQHATSHGHRIASRRPTRGNSIALYAAKTTPELIQEPAA